MPNKWAEKEKMHKAAKSKIDRCKGKTGAALQSCLKGVGRKVGTSGEWEKIRNEKSSDY